MNDNQQPQNNLDLRTVQPPPGNPSQPTVFGPTLSTVSPDVTKPVIMAAQSPAPKAKRVKRVISRHPLRIVLTGLGSLLMITWFLFGWYVLTHGTSKMMLNGQTAQ